MFIGEPTNEVRAEDKLVCSMPYEKEEDERSEINRGPRSGDGVQIIIRMAKLLTTNYSPVSPPPHRRGGPHPLRFPRYRGTEIPINRGRAPSGFTLRMVLLTTTYYLLTPYYLQLSPTYFQLTPN